MSDESEPYNLNKAIAKSRERFREWNKKTEWPPVNSQPYLEFLAVLRDATIDGWDAHHSQTQQIVDDLKKEVLLLKEEA